MRQKLTAFTLIEILVSMGIAVIVLTAGIAGFLTFRQTIQFQQAYLAVVAQLRTTQNMARNSVASRVLEQQRGSDPTGAQVDGYAIFFSGANYSLQYCLYPTLGFNRGAIDCAGTEQSNLKVGEFSDISVSATTSACSGIFFERLTGNASALATVTATPNDTGPDCQILVSHTQNAALVGRIGINVRTNNIYEI